jgi:DNA-binding response OmpR family regulator
VPTLLVSSKLSSEIMENNSLFDFLRKPFVPDQLRSRLEEILGGTGAVGYAAPVEEI